MSPYAKAVIDGMSVLVWRAMPWPNRWPLDSVGGKWGTGSLPVCGGNHGRAAQYCQFC